MSVALKSGENLESSTEAVLATLPHGWHGWHGRFQML